MTRTNHPVRWIPVVAVLAAALLTSPARAQAPVDAYGRPEGSIVAQVARYYIWYGGDRWHIRSTSVRTAGTFSGTISVYDGNIERCFSVGLEGGRKAEDIWQVQPGRRQLTFKLRTGVASDGFDFTASRDNARVRFDLRLGKNRVEPSRVFIGRLRQHPPRVPFELPARPRAITEETWAYYKALAQLEEFPDDEEANLAAGRYACFVQQDFERGLPLLARGGDAALRALAERDIKSLRATGGGAQQAAEVGDGWWELAGQQKDENAQTALRRRARAWYRRALADAGGTERSRLSERIDSVAAAPDAMPWSFRKSHNYCQEERLAAASIPAELSGSFSDGVGRVWGACRIDTRQINGKTRGWFGQALEWTAKTPQQLEARLVIDSKHVSGRDQGPSGQLLLVAADYGYLVRAGGLTDLARRVLTMRLNEDGDLLVNLDGRDRNPIYLAGARLPIHVVFTCVVRHPGEKCDTTIRWQPLVDLRPVAAAK